METYLDRSRRIRVEVVSPDKSVTARFSGEKGLSVSLVEKRIAHHDDDSLSNQVTAAVRGAAQGSRRAHALIRRERWGAPQAKPRSGGNRRGPETAEPPEPIRARSPEKLVDVLLGGPRGLYVRVRRTAAGRRVDAAILNREINTALRTALRSYTERSR